MIVEFTNKDGKQIVVAIIEAIQKNKDYDARIKTVSVKCES